MPPTSRPLIRPAVERDLPGLMSVRAEEPVHRERLARQEGGEWVYLLAADTPSAPPRQGSGGSVYGFVVLIWTGDEHHIGYPLLADLRVRESHRGRGLGSRLMAHAEWLCRERGLLRVGLSVNPTDNPRAHSLYLRRGYHDTGQRPHCDIYSVPGDDGHPRLYEDWCLCLVKDLTQEN